MQGPGGIDDDSVDTGLRLDKPHAARKSHHEHALREGFAGESIGCEDRHALQRTRRRPRLGIDEVMVTNPVALEITLVVA